MTHKWYSIYGKKLLQSDDDRRPNTVQRRPSLSSLQSSFRSYSSFRSNSPYKNFKQIFTNFKRSNNVRSTQDNLCESILVRPEHSFTDRYAYNESGQLTRVPNRPDKLSEHNSVKKQQHLSTSNQFHLNSSLNSNLHQTYQHHHQLNHHHLNQANHLHHHHHHYDKDLQRPVGAGSASYLSRTGLSSSGNIANPNSATNITSKNAPTTNPTSHGVTTANCVLTSGALTSGAMNNNVLKKCTKINEEKSSNWAPESTSLYIKLYLCRKQKKKCMCVCVHYIIMNTLADEANCVTKQCINRNLSILLERRSSDAKAHTIPLANTMQYYGVLWCWIYYEMMLEILWNDVEKSGDNVEPDADNVN